MAQVSAHRPSGLTILKLPSELIEQCLRVCSNSTLVSLCRTSRFINELATRALYRDVSVCTVGALIRCCRTLAARPTAGSALRSLSLFYPVPSTGYYTQNLYDLIRRALDSARELVHLKLSTLDPRIASVLHLRCEHPELRTFHCQLALSPVLVEFLNRHPTLTSVEVSPFENTRLARDCLPSISLPVLNHFAGNAQIAVKLERSVDLRAAFVSWDAMSQHPHLAIGALRPDNLRVLSCRRRGWNLDLFDLVSASLPDIVWLNFVNLLAVDSHPTKEFLSAVRSHLTRFKNLQRLGLQCIDTWQMGDVQCVIEDDFQTVRSWGEACRSLQQVILPHSNAMTWYRVIDDLWIPDPRDQRGAAWLYRAVMRGEYPSWDRVVGTMKIRLESKARAGALPQHEHALALARDLPNATAASVATVVTRMSETSQTQWTVRDTEVLVPSRGYSVGVESSSSSCARDWRDGRAHGAFVDLFLLTVASYLVAEDKLLT